MSEITDLIMRIRNSDMPLATQKELERALLKDGVTESVKRLIDASDSAVISKSLNVRNRKLELVFLACALSVALFVVYMFFAVNATPKSTPVSASSSTHLGNKFQAKAMADLFVKDRLESPSTAKFASFNHAEIREMNAPNTWEVYSWVDAQNAFGATMRTWYLAVMRTDGDKWYLQSLEME